MFVIFSVMYLLFEMFAVCE